MRRTDRLPVWEADQTLTFGSNRLDMIRRKKSTKIWEVV